MDIYIKIQDKHNPQNVGWWYEGMPNEERYIQPGDDIMGYARGQDYIKGTAFHSYKDVKRATKEALTLARFDGASKPVASYWRMTDDDFYEVKFDRINKKIIPIK